MARVLPLVIIYGMLSTLGIVQTSERFPKMHVIQDKEFHLGKWSVWSKCVNCWQSRVTETLNRTVTFLREERSCCTRQTKMLGFRMDVLDDGEKLHIITKTANESTKKLRLEGWSRWSDWNKCTHDCKTMRYKVCRNPAKCKKKRKYETAYCYLENSLCEKVVLHLFDRMDLHQSNKIRDYKYQNEKIHMDRRKVEHKGRTCGRKHASLKIIGGKYSDPARWPWNVALLNRFGENYCSGTLIAPRFILTAAHCIRYRMFVRFNEFDLDYFEGDEIDMRVDRYIVHPFYNKTTVNNDIALLRLTKAVKVPFACLPKDQPKHREHCSIMGWGKVNNGDVRGSRYLLETEIPIRDILECKLAYNNYHISSNMLCAGYDHGFNDTCAGDSGGGLICHRLPQREGFADTVQGITSFGDGCGTPFKYGIYTKVHKYVAWIRNSIRCNRKKPNYYHKLCSGILYN